MHALCLRSVRASPAQGGSSVTSVLAPCCCAAPTAGFEWMVSPWIRYEAYDIKVSGPVLPAAPQFNPLLVPACPALPPPQLPAPLMHATLHIPTAYSTSHHPTPPHPTPSREPHRLAHVLNAQPAAPQTAVLPPAAPSCHLPFPLSSPLFSDPSLPCPTRI